jgi:tetratricopeptide (TPR) repeat protein
LLSREADAGVDLDQAVALGYREWDVFVNRAAVALAAGDARRYEDEMREAVRAAPEILEAEAKKSGDAEGGRWIAEALERIRGGEKLLGQAEKAAPDAAAALLKKALALDPGCVKALVLRAKLLQEQGKLNMAMEDADRAVKLSPSADAYALRADLSQRLGFMEAALKDLSVAVALSPNARRTPSCISGARRPSSACGTTIWRSRRPRPRSSSSPTIGISTTCARTSTCCSAVSSPRATTSSAP